MVKFLAASAIIVTTTFAAFRFGVQVGAELMRRENAKTQTQTETNEN